MTLCQLTEDMKTNLRDKLLGIRGQVDDIVRRMDDQDACMLCKITSIKDSAYELELLASFYHFQTSLLPHVEGLDELAVALAVLSKKHHGALVAVEQQDKLDSFLNHCDTGVTIGAKVSAPLLQTIFYPGTPLHDGGVVIKNGEVVSAGCVFPLSNQKYTKEGKKIGTRHRAALGLSERTDALVLVVSEETGLVSLTINGIFHPIEVSLCENLTGPQVTLTPKK